MGLKPGQTNNKSGRPKGAKNKSSEAIRTAFQSLIETNLPQLESDLQRLQPNERIKAIIDLSKFVIPQLRASDLKVEGNNFIPIEINLSK